MVKASAPGHGRRDIPWALLAEQLAIELSQAFAAFLGHDDSFTDTDARRRHVDMKNHPGFQPPVGGRKEYAREVARTKVTVSINLAAGLRMTSAYLQIRHYRTLEKISLRDLARQLEMSPSQLSKIESGKAKLTVETAIKIAGILKVPAAVFLTERQTLPKARRSITRRGSADVYENPGMHFEVLCSEFKEKQNLFWKVRINAKSFEENGGWRQHPGQEFLLYVLSGRLELHTMYYEPLILSEGDSILFDADQPHAYVALEGDAEMIMMNSVAEMN